MSNKKILVVFGATGIQGGSVIKSILDDPKTAAEFTIRAVSRDLTKPATQALISLSVDVICVGSSFSTCSFRCSLASIDCNEQIAKLWQGDLNDKKSILNALKGACAVFLVTDFWATLSKETEINQGTNVAHAAKVGYL